MEITSAPGAVSVEVPEADENWHPVAVRWFEALGQSGQSVFYQPSDWAMAFLIAESISRDLKPQFVGVTAGEGSEPIFQAIPLKGASLSAYLKAMGDLLVSEGERRRHKIELSLPDQGDPDEVSAEADVLDIRSRLGG